MTAIWTSGAQVSSTSMLRSARAHEALGRVMYAPIDDHRTAASDSDIAVAWAAAGLIGLALLVALPL